MVAKVISGKDIRGALNYNEHKVVSGKATCILANRFSREEDRLTFHQKLVRFVELNEKNRRTKTNTLHISLNFDPSEKLTNERLKAIAETYMQRIGFDQQPFLVYRHDDAAHPHIHIVTTLIQESGKRIPIHYLGKNQSEKARKEIELEFGLVKAQDKGVRLDAIQAVQIKKVMYGKDETRRSVANVVSAVTRTYRYTSLAELNAALRQFNVTGDRGSEKSTMFSKEGLLYSLINKAGERVGIPVKASALPGKPTIKNLQKQFKLNELLRQPLKAGLIRSIEGALNNPSIRTREQFEKYLSGKQVGSVFRANSEGRIYGVTFIDNAQRVVFNGSDLGKSYSASPILERLSAKVDTVVPFSSSSPKPEIPQPVEQTDQSFEKVIADLVTAENMFSLSPEAALRLKKNRRRKKRY